MTNRPLRRKNLVIISTLKCLIPKEMNLIEIALIQIFETVRLVPPRGENVERNLTTNAEGEVEVGKFLFHRGHHIFANVALEIDLFVVVAFFPGAIATDGTDVHHATAEFDECSSLHGDIDICQIFQRPIHNLLDIILAQKLGNGLHILKLAVLVRHETILRKVVGEHAGNALAELFLLLGKIGSAHDSNGDLFGEGFHERHHIRRDLAAGDGEGAIDVEEGDDAGVCGSHFLLFVFRFVGHCEGLVLWFSLISY
mmetsp:Transcript_36843/g.77787  ORF Transcript_36843/g.77787 Transcript_36843/m.77787 type:complete len:255 (+) Transcript_36843:87-851(+)